MWITKNTASTFRAKNSLKSACINNEDLLHKLLPISSRLDPKLFYNYRSVMLKAEIIYYIVNDKVYYHEEHVKALNNSLLNE